MATVFNFNGGYSLTSSDTSSLLSPLTVPANTAYMIYFTNTSGNTPSVAITGTGSTMQISGGGTTFVTIVAIAFAGAVIASSGYNTSLRMVFTTPNPNSL